MIAKSSAGKECSSRVDVVIKLDWGRFDWNYVVVVVVVVVAAAAVVVVMVVVVVVVQWVLLVVLVLIRECNEADLW